MGFGHTFHEYLHLVPFISYYSCVADEVNLMIKIAYLVSLRHVLADRLYMPHRKLIFFFLNDRNTKHTTLLCNIKIFACANV